MDIYSATFPAYLSLYASDGQLSSGVHKLTIRVKSATSLELVVNKPLQVRTGQDAQLTSGLLDFSAASGPDHVVISVMDGEIFISDCLTD